QFLSSAVPWPYPDNGAEYFINNMILPRQGKDRWRFGIFLQENPEELIWAIELWREPIPVNRGLLLGHKCSGQGIMTEAVNPINDYAFDVLGFEKLYFSNAKGNIASRRVKEKNGAKFVKILPATFVDARFTETELWELKKEDWKKNKSLV